MMYYEYMYQERFDGFNRSFGCMYFEKVKKSRALRYSLFVIGLVITTFLELL